MEVLAADGQNEKTQPKVWTDPRGKRIQGRFRATLAGLLELEVLRLKHKAMVEAVLGKDERLDRAGSPDLQQGRYRYWVEEGCFDLRLGRSLSHENVTDAGISRTFVNLKGSGANHSSEYLRQSHCLGRRMSAEHEDRRSRASSGFCESDFGDVYSCGDDAVSSLSTSLASLSYQSAVSDARCYGGEDDVRQRRPVLLKNGEGHVRKTEVESTVFLEEAIPAAGFLSVAELYPDSHWPVVADILQPQVVLEPSYRSDLKSFQGKEIYRYPSPLHAVALQSPLYAPQSPLYAPQSPAEERKRNGRCSPGCSTLASDSLPKPGSGTPKHACLHPESRSSMSLPWWHAGGTGRHVYLRNCRCEEVILKRAHYHAWSQSTVKCEDDIHSRSKRSMASLHRTCSVGKSKAYAFNNCTHCTQKCTYFQSRCAIATVSGPASTTLSPHEGFRGRLETHKNRNRRRTAALTNLNIFRENSGTSTCAMFLDRRCSLKASGEANTHRNGHFPEISNTGK